MCNLFSKSIVMSQIYYNFVPKLLLVVEEDMVERMKTQKNPDYGNALFWDEESKCLLWHISIFSKIFIG